MGKKIRNSWGNLAVRKKLLFTMFGVVFSSILLLCGSFYYVSSDIIRNNLRKNIQSTVQQMRENLDSKLRAVNNVLFDISLDSQLQNDLTQIKDGELQDYEWAELGVNIKNRLVYQCTRQQAVTAVFLTDLEGNVYSTQKKYYPEPQYTAEEIYKKKGSNLWMHQDEKLGVIPIGKAIYNLQDQEALGYLVMYVDTDYFESVFSNVSFSREDFLFATDRKKEAVFGDKPIEGFSFENTEGEVQEIRLNQEKRQICSISLEENEWTLYCVSLDESENKDMIALRNIMFSVLLGVTVIVLVSVVTISHSISKPIQKLASSMKDFGEGNLSARVEVQRGDEIGQLGQSFNEMAKNTKHLIHEVYAERSLKQQAQLLALQMQINPHFLYNTLETINWLAIEKGSADISNVARNLGKLMRFSLKKEKKCSLEEELDAVESYIGIQRYRYGEKLHIQVDAEESCLYETIPIHILLPLVENAVEHGLSEQQKEKNIWICGRIKGGSLQLSVCDNGTGIAEEKKIEILEMREKRDKTKHMSIGMGNVQKRLSFYYGEKADFQIRDRAGGGTLILIRIPLENELEP